MASVVDICNMALGHLGLPPNISSIDPPEGSVESEFCATFWPQARDMALSSFSWGFATQIQSLAQVKSRVSGWAYQYALPVDCLRVDEVLTAEGLDSQEFEIVAEGRVRYIFSNTDKARVKGVFRVENPLLYSATFVDAVSYLMASYLAMPVTKDIKLKEVYLQSFRQVIEAAQVIDSNQSYKKDNETAAWLEARG